MATKKIPCGGFFYDDESINFDGDVMKVVGGGSGLPDPTSLPDGTAMVAVNGEWKMQEGYGYTGDPAFEPIEWDGNTEGKTLLFDEYCKVSEDVMPVDALVGSKAVTFAEGEYIEGSYSYGQAISDDIFQALYSSNATIVVVAKNTEFGGDEIEKGVYFIFDEDSYVSSLTAPASVHKFDPALIPASEGEFVIKFTSTDLATATADKTIEELFAAITKEKIIKAILFVSGSYYGDFTFVGEAFYQTIVMTDEDILRATMIYIDENNEWIIEGKEYSLTAAE